MVTSSELRLVAHILSISVLLAAMMAISLVGRRGLNMRYRLVLVLSLGFYAVWFFFLSISLRDAELVRRGDITWLFGVVELIGAVTGWTWLILTIRKSFCLAHGKPPRRIG